jgi:hypothetical protein
MQQTMSLVQIVKEINIYNLCDQDLKFTILQFFRSDPSLPSSQNQKQQQLEVIKNVSESKLYKITWNTADK